jgi:GMP synthase (glutamine-hydrolysing)
VCGVCVVCRVVFVMGPQVKEPVLDITPTRLTDNVLATLREVDHIAHTILRDSGTRLYVLLV